MKVAVDVTELASREPGGVRTGLRLLLAALRDHAPGVDAVAVAPRPVPLPEGVASRWTGGPGTPRAWRRSRALSRALEGFDVFHSPVTAHPRGLALPMTVTVHELPFVVDARLEGSWRALVQYTWLSRALSAGALLIAPSRTTRDQIAVAHPAALSRTLVVPHPAPVVPEGPRAQSDGSLLFVGRLEPRKCVGALFDAAGAWPGEVRLAGPQRPRERRRVEELARARGLSDRLRILGVVDEGRLDALIRHAAAVVLPSASEGFGFPVLEALGRGVPVIVSRSTGAAETAGDAGIAIDPSDAVAFARALGVVQQTGTRERVAREGPARLAEFPPERTARGYAEAFHRALAG